MVFLCQWELNVSSAQVFYATTYGITGKQGFIQQQKFRALRYNPVILLTYLQHTPRRC